MKDNNLPIILLGVFVLLLVIYLCNKSKNEQYTTYVSGENGQVDNCMDKTVDTWVNDCKGLGGGDDYGCRLQLASAMGTTLSTLNGYLQDSFDGCEAKCGELNDAATSAEAGAWEGCMGNCQNQHSRKQDLYRNCPKSWAGATMQNE